MRIDRLHLQDFGRFHDKSITLAPGMNVIYGANEAGKSTMKDFIIDMLYGIDKVNGIGARFDHYELRRPINGVAFSGAMEVSTEEGSYLVERNFERQDKKTVVRDLDSGRELSLQEPNDLTGTILHTDKSTYLNTLCISQMGVATDKEIAEKLNDYIVNMASTRTGDIDAVSAITELKNKKESFSNEELEQREQELVAGLELDRDFDAEIAEVKEEYAKVQSALDGRNLSQLQFTPINSNRLKEENGQDTEYKLGTNEKTAKQDSLVGKDREINMLRNMGEKSIFDNVFVILAIGLLVIALFIGIAALIPGNIPEIRMGVIGFGVLLVLITTIQVLAKRARLYQMLEELEIEKGFEEAKADALSADRGLVNRLSDLKVKEERIQKERENQEQMLSELDKLKAQMQVNNTEAAALELAMKTIRDLSEEIYDSFGNVLNEQVSEIISRITNHKYSEVKIDNQLRVMVRSGSSFISMDYLSASTIEQIYLAIRFSIANVLVTENLPIIMDDVFVNYDYKRLYETLSCLGESLNRQIIIFTVNPGIQDILADLGMKGNYIAI